MKSIIFICIAIFEMFSSASAQKLAANFRHLSSINGLTSGFISCLFKDKSGFLWIGTAAGLNRFDGSNTISFPHKIDDNNSLINNDVNMICQDTKDRIWVATGGGLSILNINDHTFKNYTHFFYNGKKIEMNEGVQSICLFKNKMWIGTTQYIIAVSPETMKFEVLSKMKLHFSKDKIRCLPNLSFASDACMWISTFSGLFYTEDGISFFNKEYNPKNWGIFKKGFIPGFCNDGDSIIYFANWKFPGIYKFNIRFNTLDSILLKDNSKYAFINFRGLCKVSKDELWGATMDQGIISIQIETGAFKFYLPDRKNPQSLSDKLTLQILKDKEGTIFIASGRGLDYTNSIYSQFVICNSLNEEIDLKLDDINVDLAEDKNGIIWIGTLSNGLISFNPETGQTEHFTFPGEYNHIWTLYFDDLNLLLGTDAGLAKFDIQKKQFTSLKNDLPAYIQEITETSFNFILKDKNENFWMGIWQNGVLKYNFKTKQYIHFSKDDSVFTLPKDPYSVSCATLDKNGLLWVGYMISDLTCINTATNAIYNFALPVNKAGDNYGTIFSIQDDNVGNIWIGTQNGGLFKYHIASKSFTLFDTKKGLSSNSIKAIQISKENDLWITTDNGLNKLKIQTNEIFFYNFSNGLPSNQYKDVPALVGKDGSIYTGCDIYLVRFQPKDLKLNPYQPKIFLNSYKKSGETILLNNDIKKLNFTYKDKVIRFEFIALNYIDPDKTEFAYYLEGFDKVWNYGESKNYATYTNLPGGDYVLKYKASNKNGYWNVPELVMKIHVEGPFWKTNWFIFLCILIAGTLSYLMYYLRLKRILDLQNVRNKIASDLHDEIGSGLSSISVFSEVLRKRTGNSMHDIAPFIEKIDLTAQNLSEAIHDIVWTINPKNDKLEDVLKRMKYFASELLNAKMIHFNFECANEIIAHKLKMEQRKNFYLIFKEAVNNIAKYAKAKQVNISIYLQNKQIHLSIVDDGIGFDKDKIQMGDGLLNMKRRADEMGAYFSIITEPGKGTSLKLNFNTV